MLRRVRACRSVLVLGMLVLSGCGWEETPADRSAKREWDEERSVMREMGDPDGVALFRVESRGLDGSRNVSKATAKYYDRVVAADLNSIQPKNDLLVQLRVFRQLEGLNLSSTPVTDQGLMHLQGNPKLRWLRLSGTKVTDAGLSNLRDLPHLRTLQLCGMPITDAGLQHIAVLPALEYLAVGENLHITDKGLRHLQSVRTLRKLYLDGTGVTDAGLVYLRDLRELEVLSLEATHVTDAGMAQLEVLDKLKEMALPKSVSKSTVAAWKQKRPNIEIDTPWATRFHGLTQEGRFIGSIEMVNSSGRRVTEAEVRYGEGSILTFAGTMQASGGGTVAAEGERLPASCTVHWQTEEGREVDVKVDLRKIIATPFEGDLVFEILPKEEARVFARKDDHWSPPHDR